MLSLSPFSSSILFSSLLFSPSPLSQALPALPQFPHSSSSSYAKLVHRISTDEVSFVCPLSSLSLTPIGTGEGVRMNPLFLCQTFTSPVVAIGISRSSARKRHSDSEDISLCLSHVIAYPLPRFAVRAPPSQPGHALSPHRHSPIPSNKSQHKAERE